MFSEPLFIGVRPVDGVSNRICAVGGSDGTGGVHFRLNGVVRSDHLFPLLGGVVGDEFHAGADVRLEELGVLLGVVARPVSEESRCGLTVEAAHFHV